MPRRKKSQLNNNKKEFQDEIGDFGDFAEHQDEILLEKAGLGRKSSKKSNDDEFDISDEEVFALKSGKYKDVDPKDYELDDAEEDGEVDYYGQNDDEDDENEDDTNWGSSKSNYYGADEVEDEEDRKLEEQEAIRLQKKHLSELGIEDHFDDDDLEEWATQAKASTEATGGKITRESLPEQDLSILDDQKKLELLNTVYPEVPLLAKELQSMNKILTEMKASGETEGDKFNVINLYIGTLCAYFALFANTIRKGEVNLHNHKVMEGLLKARELWRLVSSQKASVDGTGEEPVSEEEDIVESGEGALEDLMSAESDNLALDESESDEEESASDDEPVTVNKRKVDDEFSITVPSFKKRKERPTKELDDFAEDGDIDIDAKLARKKSLRFYTSKIDQQSKKMEKERFSGDMDLPYKDKAAAHKLATQVPQLPESIAAEADRFSDDEEPQELEPELAAGDDEAADYYNEIDAEAKQKKDNKKLSHALAVQAAKEGKLKEMQSEAVGDDEKRALNYQILKNKGAVTAKKRKEARNARVQKRKKYDKALKKLPSKRAVYKAPTSAYGGEATGIKKNLVKSVKFTS